MSDLGELLRQARLDKGLTLEQIEETTKIRKRYLEAIEQQDFSVLPGSFYVRAFIKTYAETVGLDPEEVLRSYQNVLPATETVQTEAIGAAVARKRKRAVNFDRLSKWAVSILLVLFLLLIVALIYYYFYYNKDDGEKQALDSTPITSNADANANNEQTPPAPTEADTTPVQQEEAEPPAVETPELTYVNSDRSTDIYNLSNADQLQVSLTINGGDCWVYVKNRNSDGEEIYQKTLKSGESENWELDDSVWIRLGQASRATITVNGLPINALETSNPYNVQINLVKGENAEG